VIFLGKYTTNPDLFFYERGLHCGGLTIQHGLLSPHVSMSYRTMESADPKKPSIMAKLHGSVSDSNTPNPILFF